MKILKHGNSLHFYCRGCSCTWTANKDECKKQTKYVSCMPSGDEYIYNCPECGLKTVGVEIRAVDVTEPGERRETKP